MNQSTLADPGITSFFRDPNGSSIVSIAAQQIAAPIVRGQDMTAEELQTGGGVRGVHYVLDRSPSMDEVATMLLNDFNNELVEAIREAREDDISALRIGGTSFSSDITPIWVNNGNAYHALDQLPKLTQAEYDPQQGSGTALHAAIVDGTARVMKWAAQVEADTGIQPDIDVVILTDGANNCAPRDTKPCRTMIDGRDRNRVRYVYFFFQTSDGLEDPEAHARSIGIDKENTMVFGQKAGETGPERRKRFRRMMRVLSRVSASKGASAVKANAVVQATPSADGDLV